jgi:hypothetical protein
MMSVSSRSNSRKEILKIGRAFAPMYFVPEGQKPFAHGKPH